MALTDAAPRRLALRVALAIMVSVAFLSILWTLADVDAGIRHHLVPDGAILLAAMAAYAASQIARAARLSALLSGLRRRPLPVYRISVYHTFFAFLLPMRSGEAALPLLLKRDGDVPLVEGSGVLLTARLLDLVALLAVAAIATAAVFPAVLGLTPTAAVAAMIVAAAGLLAMPTLARGTCARVERSSLLPPGRVGALVRRLMSALTIPRDNAFAAAHAATAAVWLFMFLAYYLSARSVVPGADPATVIIASTAGAFAFVLPINGIAQVGPVHAAWTAVAIAAGEEPEPALAMAVAVHAIALLTISVQALICLLAGLFTRVRAAARDPSEAS